MDIWHWKCWFGHKFSSWVHITSRCVAERFCTICQIVENKSEHRYGSWTITMSKITQIDSKGEQHEYDNHTIQTHSCQDCNYTQWENY